MLNIDEILNEDFDWSDIEIDEDEMKTKIPKEMYIALEGEVLASPIWAEGIPSDISDIMDKLCDAVSE